MCQITNPQKSTHIKHFSNSIFTFMKWISNPTIRTRLKIVLRGVVNKCFCIHREVSQTSAIRRKLIPVSIWRYCSGLSNSIKLLNYFTGSRAGEVSLYDSRCELSEKLIWLQIWQLWLILLVPRTCHKNIISLWSVLGLRAGSRVPETKPYLFW